MDEHEVLTWETFGRCVPEPAGQVVDDGYRPDLVLSPGPSPADLAPVVGCWWPTPADTGRTLAAVRDLCLPHAAEVRVAVLYDTPGSLVRPDYSWRRTDRWIDVPWSSAEAAVSGSVPA